MYQDKSLELFRKKPRIQEKPDYEFDFKILKVGHERGNIKSVSISKEYVAVAFSDTILISFIHGEYLEKKIHCSDHVNVVKFRDSQLLAVGLENGNIDLIGTFSFERIKQFKGSGVAISNLLFSKDLKWLYSCNTKYVIQLWEIREGQCKQNISLHNDHISSMCIFKNETSHFLITSSYDCTVQLYDLNANKVFQNIELKRPVESVHVHQNYLTISVENEICVYKIIDSLELLKRIVLSPKTIIALRTFKDYLVAVSLDRNVYFINFFHDKDPGYVIVSVSTFFQTPQSFDLHENILTIGEAEGGWYINVYDERKNASSKKLEDENDNELLFPIINKQKYIFKDKHLNNYLRKFKYKNALVHCVKYQPHSVSNLLNHFSIFNVTELSINSLSEMEFLMILNYLRKYFTFENHMFEFLFLMFQNNNYNLFAQSKAVYKTLQKLKKKFNRLHSCMERYQEIQDIARDILKKSNKKSTNSSHSFKVKSYSHDIIEDLENMKCYVRTIVHETDAD